MPIINFGEQGEAIHFGHINIAEYHIHIGMLLQLLQRLLSIFGKYKFVLMVSYLLPKLLFDEYFQIFLIIYH